MYVLLRPFIKSLCFVLFIVSFSFYFTSKSYALDDCILSGGSHWPIPVFVHDETTGQKWGSNSEACSPPVNVSISLGKSVEIDPNYVKDITWKCETNDPGPTIRGTFVIRPYKGCLPAGNSTLSVTLNPPVGFECTRWEFRTTNDSNSFGMGTGNLDFGGNGCRAVFGYPPDEWQRQLIMFMRPIPTPPPCGNLGNPGNLTNSCNWGGDSGRLSWSAGTCAAYYSLRFNNLSNGW